MNTPTDKHRMLARQINADCSGPMVERSSFDEYFCAQMLADHDAAQLADMTARAENAEERNLTAQHFKEETDKICDEWKARAEAAEAACAEKDAALASVNKFIREEVYREGGGQDEPPQPADQLSYDAVGYIREIEAALTVSPAETRSVIAGLREENKTYLKRIQEMYWATGNLVGDELNAVKQLASERDALRARVADLESSLKAEKWRADAMSEKEQAASHDLKKLEAQRDALIEVGSVYRRNANPEVYAVNNASWDAAVSGAQAGSKGADELAQLRAKSKLLEFIRTDCKVLYWDTENGYPLEHTLAANKDQWDALHNYFKRKASA